MCYINPFLNDICYAFSETKSLRNEQPHSEILDIAMTIFLGITACYVVGISCFKAKPWDGQGKITFPNGTLHEGEFFKGQLQNGAKKFPNGQVEEGSFKNGLLHGSGKRIYPSKLEEEGEFEEGWLQVGRKTMPNGTIEEVSLQPSLTN